MRRIFRILVYLAFTIIMSLQACMNIGLSDQLENPGTTGKSGNNTVFLFATNNSFNGNIKGGYLTAREAADDQCRLTRNTLTFPDNGCNQVRAMISLSAADSIANMPVTYGIPVNRSLNGPNNFVLANDWGTLIAGTSGKSLEYGAVMVGGTNWWSFSTTDGDYDTVSNNHCGGGTTNTSASGVVGDASTTGNTWLDSGTPIFCGDPAKLLCICY